MSYEFTISLQLQRSLTYTEYLSLQYNDERRINITLIKKRK